MCVCACACAYVCVLQFLLKISTINLTGKVKSETIDLGTEYVFIE